jgi:hypothetical protein
MSASCDQESSLKETSLRLGVRVGLEDGRLELPTLVGRGAGGRDFKFRHGIHQLPTIETMDRPHRQMPTLLHPASDPGAISTFGTLKEIRLRHARI